jgi:Lon protease-like protein
MADTRTIPLFPLPGVVLFPGTLLPLHIFEPRYRTLVAHALASDRVIGMAMLASHLPDLATGQPAIHEIGGAGTIVEHEALEDGRSNIVLEGSFRFRILREEAAAPYRTATIEEAPVDSFGSGAEEEAIVAGVRDLFCGLAPQMELPPLPSESLSAERLSGELALRLRWPPDKLQRILETASLRDRFGAIEARLTEWRELADFLRPFRLGNLDPLSN